MDDYMQHPGKVIKQNNKYYFPNRVKQCIILERIQILQCKQSELATTVVNDNKKRILEQSMLQLNLDIRA